MQSSRSSETDQDSGHHGLAVVGRTARGGGTHGRSPWTHGRTAPGARLCGFSRLPFRLPVVFALFLPCFCLIIPMYLDFLGTQLIPNTLPLHSIFNLEFLG